MATAASVERCNCLSRDLTEFCKLVSLVQAHHVQLWIHTRPPFSSLSSCCDCTCISGPLALWVYPKSRLGASVGLLRGSESSSHSSFLTFPLWCSRTQRTSKVLETLLHSHHLPLTLSHAFPLLPGLLFLPLGGWQLESSLTWGSLRQQWQSPAPLRETNYTAN